MKFSGDSNPFHRDIVQCKSENELNFNDYVIVLIGQFAEKATVVYTHYLLMLVKPYTEFYLPEYIKLL